MIGRTVSHYRVLAQIGSGSSGDVYVAEDTKLERRIALKVIPPELATDPENLERFQREAKALAALNHPNIVTIHSVEEEDGIHFLTMELVEGETLADLVPAGGMPLDQFLALALPLLEAVAAAHAHGIVHRDLKPANVMVSADGMLKVLDFGLAKLRREDAGEYGGALSPKTITQQGVLLGTLQYMSPEQVEGKPVDQRSDLFSLGATFHEMLTGERPFQGDTGAALVSSIFRDIPLAVTDLRPELPDSLASAILRCLEKDPAQRYQQTLELLAELREMGRETSRPANVVRGAESVGKPASSVRGSASSVRAARAPARGAVPSSGSARLRRPADQRVGDSYRALPRRRWLLAGAATLVLAAVGAGLLYLSWRLNPTDDPRRIVVLPFENLGQPDDAYFAAGITEEITSRLAAVNGLAVISRTSAAQYDATGKTIKQVGRDLGADFVLEGSVRWDHASAGDRVRVTPQLIRVSDDTHLWSERYERDVREIFEVQNTIAGEVVQRLNVTLGAKERQELHTQGTENLDAHLLYLRGMAYGRGASDEDAFLAVQMFEKAVALDPTFVEAFYRLSRSNSYLYDAYLDHTPERLAAAKAAAERALELAPDRPEGHKALGRYYTVQGQFDRALEKYGDVLEISPDDSQALFSTGLIQATKGNWEEGTRLIEKASTLDPQNADMLQVLADVYQRLRRFPEADEALEKAIAIIPDDLIAYYRKVDLYWGWYDDVARSRPVLESIPKQTATETALHWILQERFERNWTGILERLRARPDDWYREFPREYFEYQCYLRLSDPTRARVACESAARNLEQALAQGGQDPGLHCALGMIYAGIGRKDEAIHEGRAALSLCSDSLDAFHGPDYVVWMAKIHAQVGDQEKALDLIDRVLSQPSCLTVAFLRKDPDWDRLRQNPRFQRILDGGV